MKRKHIFLILAVLMTAFIFWNSAKPAVESAQESGRIVGLLQSVIAFFGIHLNYDLTDIIVRKSAHIAEFLVQALLISGSFTGKFKKRIVYILFFGLLTACTDEYIQLFSEGRGAMISDIFIDFGGTLAGTFLGGIFRHKGR